jgi:hypothetical protein
VRERNAPAGESSSSERRVPARAPSPSDYSGLRRQGDRQRWPIRRLSIIAAILAIGGVALCIAVAILPPTEPLASLPTYGILIYAHHYYVSEETLTFDHRRDETVIESHGLASPVQRQPKLKHPAPAYIDLEFLGPGTTVVHCPLGPTYCLSQTAHLGLQTEVNFSLGEFGTESAVIHGGPLCFDDNGQDAVVELPYVEEWDGETAPFSLQITYDVPRANEYDWSVPPAVINSHAATWLDTVAPQPDEPLGLADEANEITGSNHAAQATATDQTFTSGVLFGVVGAAALAAAQEALHLIFDQRRREEAETDAG